MKKIRIVTAFMLCVLLIAGLTACGDDTGKGSKTTPSPAATGAGNDTPAATDRPDATPGVTGDPYASPAPTGDPAATPVPTGGDDPTPTPSSGGKDPADRGNVTAYWGNESETFQFTEDYPKFAQEDLNWKLDLNGNTIYIKKTIEVASKVTFVNGTVVVQCTPGFKTKNQPDKGYWDRAAIKFEGTENAPLRFEVHKDAIGIIADIHNSFTGVSVYAEGVFMEPDYEKTDVSGSNKTADICVLKQLDVELAGGIFLRTEDPEVECGMNNFSDVRFSVNDGGIVFDNAGRINLNPYDVYVDITDGSYIYNHTQGTVRSNRVTIRIDNGIVYTNDGYMEIGSDIVITKDGYVVYNNGFFKTTGLSVCTEPGTTYIRTAITNNETGEMEFGWGSYHPSVTILAGNCAAAIHNKGWLKLSGFVHVGISDELLYNNNHYTLSDAAKYAIANYPADLFKHRPVAKSIGVINGDTGKMDAFSFQCLMNTTSSLGSDLTDRSIGVFNAGGAEANISEDMLFMMDGKDLIGFYNARNAKLSGYWERAAVLVMRSPASYQYSTGDKAGYNNADNLIGFYNEANDFGRIRLDANLYADNSIAFLNKGIPASFNDGEFSLTVTVRLHGRKSKGIENHKDLNGVYLDDYVVGDGMVCLENYAKIVYKHFALEGSGNDSMLLYNGTTGDIAPVEDSSYEIKLRTEDENAVCTNMIMVKNEGVIRSVPNFAVYGYAEKSVAMYNTVSGKLYGGFSVYYYGSNLKGVHLKNDGYIEGEYVSLSAGSEDETDVGITLLENSGTIEVEKFSIRVTGKGQNMSLGTNTGSIKARDVSLGEVYGQKQFNDPESVAYTDHYYYIISDPYDEKHYYRVEKSKDFGTQIWKDGKQIK